MKKDLYHLLLIVAIGISFTSCRTLSNAPNYQELAKASINLGVDINRRDNHFLYVEVAQWLGTPYRYGGMTRKGVDCSGFTYNVYKNVYGKELERSSEAQRKKNCRKRAKSRLKEGDLVFFRGERSRRKATHVGIYLKDHKFIHASTSKGVIVSSLNEPYYKKYWLSGGKVKN